MWSFVIGRTPVNLMGLTVLTLVLTLGMQSPEFALSQDRESPRVTVVVELSERTCEPLIVLVPAQQRVEVLIQNNTDIPRQIVLPFDERVVSVEPHASLTVDLQLESGTARLLCGPTDAIDSAGIDLEAVAPEMFQEGPAIPLATPLGA